MVIIVGFLIIGAFACFGKAIWDAGALGRQKRAERKETKKERGL